MNLLKIVITINTTNAAFHKGADVGDPGSMCEMEVARILRDLGEDLEDYGYPTELMDGNGNKVGKVDYIFEKSEDLF